MTKKEILLFFILSGLCSWMWFLPAFWTLADGSQTYTQALYSIFFSTQEREMLYGDTLDLQGTIWVFHHFDRIASGEASSILPEIYAPFGFDIGKHTGFGWGDALLSWPIIKALGTPGFYNLHVFITLTLSYWGAMMLFRVATASRLISVALAFSCCTTTFFRQELLGGRPSQIHWFFHCLFLIAIIKLLKKKPSLHWGILGGIFGVWACFVYWFGGAAIGFCGALALMLSIPFKKYKARRAALGMLVGLITIIIGLTVTARISIPIIMGEGEQLYTAMQVPPASIIDLVFFTIPIQEFIPSYTNDQFLQIMARSMIPYETLRIAFFCMLIPFAWRKRIVWLIVGIIAIGIPIGPALQWEGGWIPTGYALLHSVFPPIVRCGFNHRMIVAPVLILGIFAAYSSTALLERISSKVTKIILSCILAILIAIPSYKELPNYLSYKTSHIAIDRDLIRYTQKYPGGIIHIPIESSGGGEHIQQMFHRQPILNGPGMDTIREQEHQEYCTNNSILQSMEYMTKFDISSTPLHEKEDLKRLYDDGFRFFYIEKQRVQSTKEDFLRLLDTKEAYESRQFIMIPIPKPK